MKQTHSDQSETEPAEIGIASPDEDVSLSVDERFEILKNARRRIVLEYLADAGGTVKLDELANHVTAIENDTSVDSITSSERKRVYVGLYQFHLPKMSRMGVIEYNQDRGNVSLSERGENLYREYETNTETEWWPRYLAVGVFGIVLLVAAVLTQLWLLTAASLAVETAAVVGLSLYHRALH